jgi:hypothetical protein
MHCPQSIGTLATAALSHCTASRQTGHAVEIRQQQQHSVCARISKGTVCRMCCVFSPATLAVSRLTVLQKITTLHRRYCTKGAQSGGRCWRGPMPSTWSHSRRDIFTTSNFAAGHRPGEPPRAAKEGRPRLWLSSASASRRWLLTTNASVSSAGQGPGVSTQRSIGLERTKQGATAEPVPNDTSRAVWEASVDAPGWAGSMKERRQKKKSQK